MNIKLDLLYSRTMHLIYFAPWQMGMNELFLLLWEEFECSFQVPPQKVSCVASKDVVST